MSDMKCKHDWEYFDDHDFPNGYEYEQVNIPHKRCKKCGREYELFDGYGEYAKRWRKVEYWSPEIHRLEQELMRTRKALDIAVGALNKIINAQGQCWGATDTEIKFDCKHYANEALDEITALEQKDK